MEYKESNGIFLYPITNCVGMAHYNEHLKYQGRIYAENPKVFKALTAHQSEVVLKRATTHRIASAFKFGQRIGTGINEVVDSPAAIMILKTLVYCRNANKSSSIKGHNQNFSAKIANFLEVHKSVAHRLLNFAVNLNGKPPRTSRADMRFQFTREGFAVALKIQYYDY